MLGRRPERVCAVERHPSTLGELGDESLARRLRRCVEERSQEAKSEHVPELEHPGAVEERDTGHRSRTYDVAADTRDARPDPVGHHASEERTECQRHLREERGDAGAGRASGRHEHEPSDRDRRDRVPEERDGVCGCEREKR